MRPLDAAGGRADACLDLRSHPASQRTDKKLSKLVLHPATEFFLDDASIARFRAGYRELFGVINDNDPLYESISAGRRYNGMDHWLPLFFDQMDTLFDYAPNALVTMDAAGEQARAETFHSDLAI